MLFIVPLDAAGTLPGMALASAPSRTSVIRWEVSTFPPATAAGGRALTTLPSGATSRMGLNRPEL
jgi:hypothetical protein